MKVLRHLENVDTVIYGDFLGSGMSQALFFPRASPSVDADSAADILSVVDAELASARSTTNSFGRRFLLTDFSQITIDRWNSSVVIVLMIINQFFCYVRVCVLVNLICI